MTERAEYRFIVKGFEDGTPWIVLEPMWKKLEILRDGFLAFDLPEGTTITQAKEIAAFLDENIEQVAYTE